MPDRVLVEILVAAPIETVWKAVRVPAQICQWFGWEYPKLEEDVETMFVKYVKADDEKYIAGAEGMTDRFELEPQGSHTIVRIIRSAPVTDPGWQGVYDDSLEGWITFMQQLKFALERHRTDTRRTLYLNGRAKAAGTPLPIDALDPALAIVPVGDPYQTKSATGETLAGRVWHRAGHQLGLTVDAYGDGLVVISTRPRTAKSPHGGGNILVTTYGLDDAAFAALRRRWSDWWQAQYEVIEILP